MRHYLGLDAGGTKTWCLVADETGAVRGFGAAGTGSYEYKGVGPAAIENRKAIDRALDEAKLRLEDIAAIGMGIAGADVPDDYVMLERELYTPLFGQIPRSFRNDSFAALRGGTREPHGVVIACGTGCVCAGRNRKSEEARVGGLGEEFGDICSGSSLGREALRAVWRARDQVLPATRLTQLFLERSGCSDADELFFKMYRQELTYANLEPMAKLLFDAAFEGDVAACDILQTNGRYLGMMVNAAIRKLNMAQDDFEVVMAGSVFKGSSPVLMDAMRAEIHRYAPRARTAMPVFEPVVGALLMGMELNAPVTHEIYGRLTETLNAAGKKYNVSFSAALANGHAN